jgi:hypothetical protein
LVVASEVRIICAASASISGERRGLAALGAEAVERIVKTIAVFDDFCHANDPYEEHDFGSFEADGHIIMFKIDYFDRDLSTHSPDPADLAVTQRVITIMLAEEY